MLPRPATTQPRYGEVLADAGRWRPYVLEVLDRAGLPAADVEAPYAGTFPTFLSGDVVVKLFGPAYDGAQSHATELALAELLGGHPEIQTPALLSSGDLYDDAEGWTWPYLVYARLGGRAIRESPGEPAVRRRAAAQLGALVAALHRLPVPELLAHDDLLACLREDAPERLRRFGLPGHLADQAPAYLADAPEARTLVHADLTDDHVFVDGDGLVGVIDWGDAMAAHPGYELVAVRFAGLSDDRELLRAFVEAYDAPAQLDDPRRALQGILEFRFDAVSHLARRLDLTRFATLEQLAEVVHRRL